MKIRETKIFDPIFRANIIITFGKLSEMKGWFKKNNLDWSIKKHWEAFSQVLERDNGELDYHIHFDLYGFTTIVHETNHTTWNILSDRGIRFNEHTKEVFAYHQDWLAGRCRDILEDWTKKKRKR